MALGTVESILEEVKRLEIGTPGIIVIGKTVGLHTRYALKSPAFVEKYNHIIHATASRA